MSELIPQEDAQYIASVEERLKDTWSKRQVFRTETEMRVSVLNDVKHPTAASKYWQAVREQSVFYENLKLLSFDYRKNEVKIAKVKRKLKKTEDDLDRELLEIKLDELMFRRQAMEQQGKDRIREIRLWEKIMEELDDGSFDTRDPNTHQMVSLALSLNEKVKMMDNNTPVADRANVAGVYHTAVRHLEEAGLLERDERGQMRIKEQVNGNKLPQSN